MKVGSSQNAWVQSLALPLTSNVTIGKDLVFLVRCTIFIIEKIIVPDP